MATSTCLAPPERWVMQVPKCAPPRRRYDTRLYIVQLLVQYSCVGWLARTSAHSHAYTLATADQYR
eukprot:COSAG01_NODE_2715_length_7199_cov_15.544507_4_plen_66_part_00